MAAGGASLLLWLLMVRLWITPWLRLRESLLPGHGASAVDVAAAMAQLQREQAVAAEHQKRTSALLDALPQGVLVVDDRLHLRLTNAKAHWLLDGEAANAVASAPLHGLVEAAFRGRTSGQDDLHVARSQVENDQHRAVMAEVSPYRWAGSSAALVVLSDVSVMRRLERVRRDFVANVSHELRTPITAISGFLETMLDNRMHHSEEARHFLQIAQRQTQRMDAIIGDLLVLTKLETDEERSDVRFETVTVARSIESVIQVCQAAAGRSGVSLEVECEPTLTGRMSPQLVEQALINLIDNAIKYGKRGSAVRLSAAGDTAGVRIAVSDSGAGIPGDQHERIFERFYRVDRSRGEEEAGTGLGLAIVKHIALVHGGSVELVSVPGQGSTFSLLLPH